MSFLTVRRIIYYKKRSSTTGMTTTQVPFVPDPDNHWSFYFSFA